MSYYSILLRWKLTHLWSPVPYDFDANHQVDDIMQIRSLVEAEILVAVGLLGGLLLTIIKDLEVIPGADFELGFADFDVQSRETSDWLLAANLILTGDADII